MPAKRASLDQTLHIIQLAYPQVYLACHTRHQRKRTTQHALSARDSSILSHLGTETPVTPASLARHLGIARSTLSEAIKRLTLMGFTAQSVRETSAGSRGGVAITLTPKGVKAIRETSVLEEPRLRAVLSTLTPSQLRDVARGMSALASGCARLAAERSAK
jgi:DNA-binding MarR family transcriptional regulator